MSPVTVPAGLRLRVEGLETATLPDVCVLPGEPATPAWATAANQADACTFTQAHASRIRGLLR